MKQICLLVFLTAHLLPAQKIVKKSIINPEIGAISIDATNNFELSFATAQGNEMILEATLEGEYKNDLLLNVQETGKTIMVNTGFQPNFKKPNDKLGAHKVVSIALKIVVPEQMSVTIFGTYCNVSAKGKYHSLKITLNDGSCVLDQVSGTAVIATQSGTISVTANNAEIKAKTKYGEVRGNDTFRRKSVRPQFGNGEHPSK